MQRGIKDWLWQEGDSAMEVGLGYPYLSTVLWVQTDIVSIN